MNLYRHYHPARQFIIGMLILSILLSIAQPLTAAVPVQASAPASASTEPDILAPPCPEATIQSSRNATRTREPDGAEGTLLSASGRFNEHPPDEPCDIPPVIAPVTVSSGGVISATINGSPAAPCTWSLGNFGTGMVVHYTPLYGPNEGPTQEVVSLKLSCAEEAVDGSDGHIEMTGVVPGPGVLKAYLSAPAGTGPLTGSCFKQSFDVSVQMMEPFADAPVTDGMALRAGDRLRTEDDGYMLVEFGHTGSMLVKSEIELLNDFPPLPETLTSAPTQALDLPSQGTPLVDRFGQFEKDGLLHPIIRDFGQYDAATLGEAENILEAGESVGGNRCIAAVEATLLLNSHASDFSLARLGSAFWTLNMPDQYDYAEWIAKQALPKLLPVVSALGTLDDIQDRLDLFTEYVQRQQLSELWTPALEEWQSAKGFTTKAEVDARIETIRNAQKNLLERRNGAAEREVEAMNAILDEPYYANLKRHWNEAVARAAQRTAETGVKQPVVFIWPQGLEGVRINYQARLREIERQTNEEIFKLTFEARKLELAAKILETYRAPLAEMSCDEFLNQLAMEQPTLSACSQSPRSVSLVEGFLHYLGATDYRDGDVMRWLGIRGYRPGDETPVQVGERWIYPKGTEYLAERTQEGGRVSVIRGSIVVVGEDGAQEEIAAGEQLTWPGDLVSSYEPSQDPALEGNRSLLHDNLLGSAAPASSGVYQPQFVDGKIPDDWVWQDPGDDTLVETTEDGALRLTVPPENDLWQGRADAPRLLHRVTGDFDLEGTALLDSEGTHIALSEFVIAAPGSALGYLAGQQPKASESAQYQLLGGGWVKSDGLDKLASLACSQPDFYVYECPDAPGEPVRFRLSRRDDLWRTFYSLDGEHWELSTQREIIAPETVWAGWTVKRMAYDGVDAPAVFTLSDVTLTTSQERELAPLEWSFAGAFVEGVEVDVQQVEVVQPQTEPDAVEQGAEEQIVVEQSTVEQPEATPAAAEQMEHNPEEQPAEEVRTDPPSAKEKADSVLALVIGSRTDANQNETELQGDSISATTQSEVAGDSTDNSSEDDPDGSITADPVLAVVVGVAKKPKPSVGPDGLGDRVSAFLGTASAALRTGESEENTEHTDQPAAPNVAESKESIDNVQMVEAIETTETAEHVEITQVAYPSQDTQIVEQPYPSSSVSLSLDSSRLGSVTAFHHQPMTGDFDVIVRVDADAWERQPGETRIIQISAQNADKSNWIYVQFAETDYRRVFGTQLQVDGTGLPYHERPTEIAPSTQYRIVRSGDLFSALVWERCGWKPIWLYEGAPTDTMYLQTTLSNEWEASQPAEVRADITVEHLTSATSGYHEPPWTPGDCSVLEPIAVATGLSLPDDLIVSAFQAPFNLGNGFFDDQGQAYVFSNEKDEQTLLVLDGEGTGRVHLTHELLAGLNAKAGVMTDDSVLMVVDYWPDGGNAHGGLYRLKPDGSYEEWTLNVSAQGLSEIVESRDGGWLISDFEVGAVWQVVDAATDAIPLADQGERPAGVGALGYATDSGELLAVYDKNWSSTGTTGLFKIADGAAERFIDAPADIGNLRDLAVSPGGVLEEGVYVTDMENGQILRLHDGLLTPVISGIEAPTTLSTDPSDGRLLLVYDQDKILIVSRE